MISAAQTELNSIAMMISLYGATIDRLQALDKALEAVNAELVAASGQPKKPHSNPWERRRSGYYEIFDTEGWSDFARVVVKIEGEEGDCAWGRELSDLLFSAPVLKAENERLQALVEKQQQKIDQQHAALKKTSEMMAGTVHAALGRLGQTISAENAWCAINVMKHHGTEWEDLIATCLKMFGVTEALNG